MVFVDKIIAPEVRPSESVRVQGSGVKSIGAVETACFWLFPRQILALFGSGADGYEAFALRYMHEFMLLVILAGVLPISMQTMVSIKRPQSGIIISLSKQLVLIALLLVLPPFMGIDGILCAGPVADFLVAAAAFFVIRSAFRRLVDRSDGAGMLK